VGIDLGRGSWARTRRPLVRTFPSTGCSVAINADISMAWLAVVRIRQRNDSTIVVKW
jgi:hypothetical protein